MFTGIIQTIGKIVGSEALDDGIRLRIDAGAPFLADVGVGDSIAVEGACLTAVKIDGGVFAVEVSRETLDCTVGFPPAGEVNLEKALRLSDRLGGHWVTGHVDGVGAVRVFEAVGESHRLVVEVPASLARYIVRKGSVTINGVSLTVNEAEGSRFAVNLIPHTLQATTLKRLEPGKRVNLEIDLLARYLERMLLEQRSGGSGQES